MQPGVLQFMGLQSVGQDLATEQHQQLPSYLVPYHTLISVRFNACPIRIFVYAACYSSLFFTTGNIHLRIVVQLISRVQLLSTPWTAAHQAAFHHLPELAQTHVH